MRKIREVLRRHFEHGRSRREIVRIINVSPTTVSDYLARAKLAGLSSLLPPETDDATLEQLLFPPNEPSLMQRPAPAWPTVHNEPRREGARSSCDRSTRPSNQKASSTAHSANTTGAGASN